LFYAEHKLGLFSGGDDSFVVLDDRCSAAGIHHRDNAGIGIEDWFLQPRHFPTGRLVEEHLLYSIKNRAETLVLAKCHEVARDLVKYLVAHDVLVRPGRVPLAKSLTTNIVGNIKEMQLMARSHLLPASTGRRCSSNSAATRYGMSTDRCTRSWSSSGVERQCAGQSTPASALYRTWHSGNVPAEA
jgi:hypothetical protein